MSWLNYRPRFIQCRPNHDICGFVWVRCAFLYTHVCKRAFTVVTSKDERLTRWLSR